MPTLAPSRALLVMLKLRLQVLLAISGLKATQPCLDWDHTTQHTFAFTLIIGPGRSLKPLPGGEWSARRQSMLCQTRSLGPLQPCHSSKAENGTAELQAWSRVTESHTKIMILWEH